MNVDIPSTPQLDRALTAARKLVPPDVDVKVAIQRIQRQARLPKDKTPWVWTLRWAVAALLAIVVYAESTAPQTPVTVTTTALPEHPVLRVGHRVAVLASAEADFSVRQAELNATTLELTRGMLTVRLLKNQTPHRLRVLARDIEAAALGTTYSVGIDSKEQPFVAVHEGVVRITTPDSFVDVAAGGRWPRDQKNAVSDVDAKRLAAVTAWHEPKMDEPPATPPRKNPVMHAHQPLPSALWQTARAARERGDIPQALSALTTLAATEDPVWTPIALVEQMRLLEQAQRYAEVETMAASFLARYPNHDLANNVRDLLNESPQRR